MPRCGSSSRSRAGNGTTREERGASSSRRCSAPTRRAWLGTSARSADTRPNLERAARARDARRLGHALSERLRLLLERAGAGYRLRDAATVEVVRWEDERVRVVPVAGGSFRPDAGAGPAFGP